MKVIFVRHADPCKDCYDITEDGRYAARKLRSELKKMNICHMYTCTILRTIATGDILEETLRVPVDRQEWLNEFKHPIILPDQRQHYIWQIPPRFWADDAGLIGQDCLDEPMYKSGDISHFCLDIWDALDALLASYGYVRKGNCYENHHRGSEAVILIVSHFATISVMLSHMLNLPLTVLMNSFWAAPASFTTLRTEEIEQGTAIFRCIGYGETGYLSSDDSRRSFYGLQPEFQ